jgi:hypothetical protein
MQLLKKCEKFLQRDEIEGNIFLLERRGEEGKKKSLREGWGGVG